MKQLPIVWERLVSTGRTCPRCDATYQHLQSVVAKLREAPCRTMEVEGATFEDIPEVVIMNAALIAASGLIGQPA